MLSAQQQGALLLAEAVVLGLVGTALDSAVDHVSQFVEAYLVVDTLHRGALLKVDFVIIRAVERYNNIPGVQAALTSICNAGMSL